MNLLINALAVILGAVAIGTATIVTAMIAYVSKQAKWESELKHYKKNPDRTVTNRQGHIIHTPSELLDELAGFEERIAK